MRALFAAVVFCACAGHTGGGGGGSNGPDGGGSGFACGDCGGFCSPTLGCVECDPNGSAACDGNNVVSCNPDGTFGATQMACTSSQQCVAGTCTTACGADGVDLVYVVDEQNDFMSFDPSKLPADPFTKIGTLTCPTSGAVIQTGASGTPIPFSMSIDRNGTAWVLYNTGQLFQVSLTTAACTAAGNTVGAGGMNLFGMGFSTDTNGGTAEHLFLAGGNDSPQATPRKLASMVPSTSLTPTVIGNIAATSDFSPELTGTNTGHLYGFYPNLISPAFVQEIDKTSGAAVGSAYNLGTSGLGAVTDWAFAQWGGKFYIFVTVQSGIGPHATKTSSVQSIDPSTGMSKVELSNVSYYIDGAGVSTCAPSVIL